MADYKSSGTDTVIKIVLVFFISLLSFSIGTFVGKKFSDNQHKMVAMEPSHSSSNEHEQVAEHTGSESSAGSHGEKNTEHAVSGHGTTKATGHGEGDALSDDQVAALEEEMTAEEDLASTAPKHEPASESPKLSSVLAREVAKNGIGKFTIQIASYPTQEEAEKKVTELKSLKFDSFATEATIKGHQWYRVNVGMFATIKEAQDHKTLLAEKAKVTTAIVQKLNK